MIILPMCRRHSQLFGEFLSLLHVCCNILNFVYYKTHEVASVTLDSVATNRGTGLLNGVDIICFLAANSSPNFDADGTLGTFENVKLSISVAVLVSILFA